MSTNINYKTIIIAIIFSVILSTGITLTMPQVQEALRGPQGEQGIQGLQGQQGIEGSQGVPGEPGSDADVTALEAQHAYDIAGIGSNIYDLIVDAEYLIRENIDRQNEIDVLEAQIADLESTIAILEAVPPGLGAPDFDSGWIVAITGHSQTFWFSSEISDFENTLVYVEGAYWNTYGEKIIHHMRYGLDTIGVEQYPWIGEGLYWFMDHNSIDVQRGVDDLYWEEFRIRIWELPPPPT